MVNLEEAKLAAGILEEAGWEVTEVKVLPKVEAGTSYVEIRTRPPGGRLQSLRARAENIQDAARAAVREKHDADEQG